MKAWSSDKTLDHILLPCIFMGCLGKWKNPRSGKKQWTK